MKHGVLLFLVLALALAVAACNRVEIERNPEGGATVTLTLTQSDLNTIISEALAAAPNPLLRNPQVTLQEGSVLVSGTHERRDGGGTVSGSFVVTFSIQDGALVAQVSSLNIEGYAVADSELADLNARLAGGMSRRADDGVRFTSVTVTPQAVTLVFEVRRR